MPIYEYGCQACGEVVERYEVRMNEQAPPKCCGEPTVKLMSACIFDLRGSGFHQNDYGNGAHKLSATHQAQRASVECAQHGLRPAQPREGNNKERAKLEKMAG